VLAFAYRKRTTAFLRGPATKLALVEQLVAGRPRLTGAELADLQVPADLETWGPHRDALTEQIARLLDEGQVMVETVERLVCRLYGVPESLEEAVVAHAQDRASAP